MDYPPKQNCTSANPTANHSNHQIPDYRSKFDIVQFWTLKILPIDIMIYVTIHICISK